MFHVLLPTSTVLVGLVVLLAAIGCAQEDPPPLRLSVDTSDVQTQDIARVLQNIQRLDTLTAHLQRANLLDELRRDGPFTVFAPIDAAFAAAPPRLDSLLRARNDSSRALLAHHLARGRYDSSRVGRDTLRLSTLALQPVQLHHPNGRAPLHVNRIPIRRTIHAGNGVIHVIESLIAPPQPDSLRTAPLISGEQ